MQKLSVQPNIYGGLLGCCAMYKCGWICNEKYLTLSNSAFASFVNAEESLIYLRFPITVIKTGIKTISSREPKIKCLRRRN
jgi:hypothetical protein